MLILPESLREEARKPFGRILQGKAAEDGCRKAKKPLIAVGDQCIYNLITAGITPDIFIFDFKIRRKEVGEEMKRAFAPFIPDAFVVLSPPGAITDELSIAVERVLGEGKGAIFVAGEDDLSSLLVMAKAEEGTLVYGQPEEGAVIVPLGKGEAKKRSQKLLLGMGQGK